ncbi:MAG: ABC transporter permease [Bacillota bacterium]|jgi:putative ABC transport system permease protein|nr:ABC transporter permease [Bacillota bacterium]NLM08551.1 ABC transporter permease [Clostridiales Family XIII bacterium]
MNSKDLLLLGVKNLLRRKTRTILAIIGVVVGTCAIIVMLSIGFGMSANFEEQIASYGDLHLVNVYGGGMYGYGTSAGDGQPAQLDDKAIAAFERIEGVDAATPRLEEFMTVAIGKYVTQVSVVGIRPEVMQKFGYELQDGRLLQPGDKFNLVFGNQVPSWFYNSKKTMYGSWDGEAKVDVITDKIIITGDFEYGQKRRYSTEDIDYKEYKARGVGLLANPNNETAYYVYTDLDTMKEIQADLRKARKESATNQLVYNNAMVYVGDINDVQDVSDAIREMGFQTHSLNDWLEAMQEQARMIQTVLGGIGAISLFVAALGITNTMIMSIYERTKEIGVMKVIGANLADIRRMFLLEAGLIGFLGGLIGVMLSFIISLLLNTALAGVLGAFLGGMMGGGSNISIIPWWTAVGGLLFATVIGLISGYSPARRAMRLSALESLRNE